MANKYNNIFSFATKELSQDAFLAWVIANYQCNQKDVREISRVLLSHFMAISDSDKFDWDNTRVVVKMQLMKVDIVAEIDYLDQQHVIAIEDKTTSKEHNQLEGYNDVLLKRYPNHTIHRIFYKTNFLDEDERTKVHEADWQVYDIKSIYEIFSRFNKDSIANHIINDYRDYVIEKYVNQTTPLPISLNQWKLDHWINLYNNHISGKHNVFEWNTNFRNYYNIMGFRIKTKDIVPLLEFRSKDFIDKNDNRDGLIGKAYILVDLDNMQPSVEIRSRWKGIIDSSRLYSFQSNDHQIAIRKSDKHIDNLHDLQYFINTSIEEYIRLFGIK